MVGPRGRQPQGRGPPALRRRPGRHHRAPRPPGVARCGRRLHDALLPGAVQPPLRHDVARQMRDVMGRVAPDALLVGEHFHDYTSDMPGDGWHGVMNYAGFCKPAWTWLRQEPENPRFLGAPVPLPLLDAGAVVDTMR